MPLLVSDARSMFSGLEQEVPLLHGNWKRYVNLDNAATTPPFRAVVELINDASNWYSSVHRGTGAKSLLCTHLYNQSRDTVAQFVGADPDYHTVIFCSNTTDAINRLCRSLPHEPDDVVLTTVMEHHSNLLPWRFCGKVDYARINQTDGSLDLDDVERKLREHKGKVKMVAVTGASNITGHVPPIRHIAAMAHRYGARIMVDGAQLLAHRPVTMGAAGDPERIDFLVFSGHKMYAPFGSGALVGPRECFEEGAPYPLGGGAVELVTLNEVEWADVPEKQEAGSPNLIGALALAKAMQMLQGIGMESVAAHERELTTFALEQLSSVPGVRVYGDTDSTVSRDRVGVIPLLSEKINHGLLAAILSYEYGIGVRNGCFCAHPYAGQLLGLDDTELADYVSQIRNGDRGNLPGFVRVSLGLYNTVEEIDYLATALREIAACGPMGRYHFDRETGQYHPEGFSYSFDSLFSL